MQPLAFHRPALEQFFRRPLAAVVPVELQRLAPVVGRELEGDLRPLREAVPVMAAGGGHDRGRILQVQAHVGHVHGMAGHVAQGPRAEVPAAAPRHGVVARRRNGRHGAGPIHRSQSSRRGPASAWASPLPCSKGQLGRSVHTWTSETLPRTLARNSAAAFRSVEYAVPWLPIWVADFLFAGDVGHQPGLPDRARQRLLAETVLAHLHRLHRHHGVAVVRRADDHRVDALVHLRQASCGSRRTAWPWGTVWRRPASRRLSVSQMATRLPNLAESMKSSCPLQPETAGGDPDLLIRGFALLGLHAAGHPIADAQGGCRLQKLSPIAAICHDVELLDSWKKYCGGNC